MKTKKIILLAFVAVAVFASSCKKEIKYEFPKGLIPYELGQIISFTDNEGKVIDLTVTENSTKWIREDIDSGGLIDDEYTLSEIKTVVLKSEANNFEIRLVNGYHSDCDPCKDYTLRIGIYVNNRWDCILSFDRKGNYLNHGGSTSFHESLEINGKVYLNVVEKIGCMDHGVYDGSYQLYYNKPYGILQINREGENFLTLNHSNR